MSRRVTVLLAAFVLAALLPPARGAWRNGVETLADSGITIEATSPFDNTPPSGCLPVWVTIRNASGSARVWTITTDTGASYGRGTNRRDTSDTVRVENGQAARVPILVPLDTQPSGFYYRNLTLRVDGYGTGEGTVSLPEVNARAKGSPTPCIGMGEDLATPIWASLSKWYADKGHDLTGSPVDLDLLDGDWRALSGFDVLWLSDASYARLDAARRTAVRDWVSHGGLLCLCAQTADASVRGAVGLPPEGNATDVGLGRVRLIVWDGKELAAETVAAEDNQPRVNRADATAESAEDWTMTKAVGTIPVNALFLIGFIVVFAVLVGPVNLFVFARSARRHRLFWTTPLISVVASLLLGMFILFKDGFGGSGQRALLCVILPDQKKTVVVQEQVALTGVVLSRGFEVGEDTLLAPVQIKEGATRVYRQEGRRFFGDWFSSRSVQAHRMDAVVPSRAEITLANADAARGGAPPVFTSSVPATIRRIAYFDPAGRRWVGDALRTGERITLREGEVEAGAFSPGGSSDLDVVAGLLLDRRGGFVALADDGPFLETLPSIRWTTQRAVFAGDVTGAR